MLSLCLSDFVWPWHDRQVHEIIQGIIEGETRVFSAGLTIKEMFEDREKFRKTVADRVGTP